MYQTIFSTIFFALFLASNSVIATTWATTGDAGIGNLIVQYSMQQLNVNPKPQAKSTTFYHSSSHNSAKAKKASPAATAFVKKVLPKPVHRDDTQETLSIAHECVANYFGGFMGWF